MKAFLFLLSACLCWGSSLVAAEATLKPFILASNQVETPAAGQARVKAALTGAGFTLAGETSPYAGTQVLVVTSDALRQAAAKSPQGGFGAVQRVALVQAGEKLQVSFTNPVYMAQVYRMSADLTPIQDALTKALGKQGEFGMEGGMTAKQARGYHYKMMMPYFDDVSELATHASHQDALAAVEKGLAANAGGASKVYRVDLPGKEESVFGVALTQKVSSDKFIMSEIDFKEVKSAAHLPYELLVTGNKVIALRAEFRIAINFPDLSMMGANSFMNIMDAPSDIEEALTQVAKGGP